MFVFVGDQVLIRDGMMELEARPDGALSCSLELPSPWQEPHVPRWCELDESVGLGPGDELIGLRDVWRRYGDEALARAGAAWQYVDWHRNVRLCAACGAPLTHCEADRGRRCPVCGRVVYAPLSPAIIVAVEREGKILLAHNAAMPKGRYSVIAGFVEPGETLEEAVAREVREEVSIEVRDVRYFGSQAWPFPRSLMLGFTAQWASGELRPDGVEIEEALWAAPDDLPASIPEPISISRRLIDDFLARARGGPT